MNRHRTARLCATLLAGTSLSCALLLAAPVPAWATPTGGTVVAGTATISGSGATQTVTQTSKRAIIDWQSFSLSPGEVTNFVLPSSSSAILNRVTGGNPALLLGDLTSNGQVYLIDSSGVVIGPKGRIQTAAFAASTLDLSNAAFLQGGPLQFSGGSAASITNFGAIETSAGDVVLIGLNITNQGTLKAPNGQAILAAGGTVLYVPDGQSAVLVAPAAAPASIDNEGMIAAASAQLRAAGSAYALAVNNGGTISATTVTQSGGQVVLDGGAGDVVASGDIAATGTAGAGGTIDLSGGRVAVTGTLDASGATGGGQIGLTATGDIAVTSAAAIHADATQTGNGGQIDLKAAVATQFDGDASARGGSLGGNGGSADISGGTLGFTGSVALTAPHGVTGTLLFDPDDITIASSGATVTLANVLSDGSLWSFAANPGSQTILASDLVAQLANSNLTLQATHSITVNAPIVSSTSNSLEMDSPTIAINQSIQLPNGVLTFFGETTSPQTGDTAPAPVIGVALTSQAGATISAQTVFIDSYAQTTLSGPVQAGALFVNQDAGNGLVATSFSAVNSGNAIGSVQFGSGFSPADNYSGSVALSTTGALSVAGMADAAGGMTITATGDLTMTAANADSQTQLGSSGGQITLASTGGAFINDTGPALFSGAGRRVIYSSTQGSGYTDGGLGFTVVPSVNFPNDPDSSNGAVIYIGGAPPALPVLTITANNVSELFGQSAIFTAKFSGGSVTDLQTLPQFKIVGGTGVNAGAYTIQPFGATANGFQIVYVSGVLTVAPAPLTIVATTVAFPAGGTLPALTGTFSGLAPGDTQASTGFGFSVSLPSFFPVTGVPFPITLTGSDPNYAVTYVPGFVVVGPPTSTILPQTNNTLNTEASSLNSQLSSMVDQTQSSTLTNTNYTPTNQTVTINIPTVTPTFDYMGLGSGAQAEETIIVQNYVNAMAGTDPPVTLAGVEAELSMGGANAVTLQGDLLPFVYAQLETILDTNQSDWTPAEAAFVTGMENFISQQQQQAAIQAENQYAAWQQQEQAQEEAQLSGLSGPAYVEEAAILSANPPVPPEDFLEIVQGGSALTGQQSLLRLGIEGVAATVGSQASTAALQDAGAQLAWLQANDTPQMQATLSQYAAQLKSSDPDTVANAEALINSAYQAASGPSNLPGLAAGAVGDVGTALAKAMIGGAPKVSTILGPKLGELIQTSQRAKAIIKKATGNTDTTDATDATDATDDVSQALEDIGLVTGPVGLALELAGNVAQIGVAAAGYSQVATYNAAFRQAVNTANTPVTVATLQQMMNSTTGGQGQLMSYIAGAMAIGNASPPAEAPTTSLTALMNYAY